MATRKAKAARAAAAKVPPTRRPAAWIGDNSLEGRAQPYLTRIENLLADLESRRDEHLAACKPLHEDIREVYSEAKDHDIPVKALKGLVKWRTLERKQAGIAADFEDLDEKASFDQLVDALGPLGFAAAVRAGYADADEAREMHGPIADAGADERADEAELARVGRGHEPAPLEDHDPHQD